MKYIVLSHGVLGFSTINILGFNFADYFNGVKKALKDDGYEVFTPAVPFVASIETRAQSLHKKLHEFINEKAAPENSIAIFAHSMGGLDARRALVLEEESLAKYVKCLVTIGTPHLGSPIAELLAEKYSLTNFFYTNALNILGDSVGALKNLTPDFCKGFDEETKNAENVEYYSVAGVIDSESNSSAFFRALGRKVGETNDGVVGISSAAKNNNGWVNLKDWSADHAGLVGWFKFNARKAKDDHIKRYRDLAKKVLRLE